MAFIYDMVDTWNNAGTTFTAIKMNVTDTASQAASLLMDLQIAGTNVFGVRKDGTIFGQNSPNLCYIQFAPNVIVAINNGLYVRGNIGRIGIDSTYGLMWNSNGNADGDVALSRVSAGLLELNTGTSTSYAHLVLFTNRTVGVTFASLPGVASVSVGGRAMITNSTTAVFNATAAGGGANVVPVFSDGTQWRVG